MDGWTEGAAWCCGDLTSQSSLQSLNHWASTSSCISEEHRWTQLIALVWREDGNWEWLKLGGKWCSDNYMLLFFLKCSRTTRTRQICSDPSKAVTRDGISLTAGLHARQPSQTLCTLHVHKSNLILQAWARNTRTDWVVDTAERWWRDEERDWTDIFCTDLPHSGKSPAGSPCWCTRDAIHFLLSIDMHLSF